MTGNDIKKMADGFPPTSIGMDQEEVVMWMAKHSIQLQEQVRALAAEVQAVRWASGQVYSAGYNHGHLNTADGMPYAEDSDLQLRGTEVLDEFTDPDHRGDAADAVIREIRAQAVEEYAITVGAEKNGAIYAARIRAGEQP